MDRYDFLYNETESAQVDFFGFISDKSRFDFGIIYTRHFFGKPLVVCMQTGQSALLSSEDAINPDNLQRIFRLNCPVEAKELAEFFQDRLPPMPFEENQY